jgi:actin-related protein 6
LSAQTASDACSMSSCIDVGVVLDNGAGSIKAGIVPLVTPDGVQCSATAPLVATNSLARPGPNATPGSFGTSKRPNAMLAGAEIDAAPDFSGMSFRRAHERGYITSWDTQVDVWASVFSSDMGIGLQNASSATLLLTEPVATPPHIRQGTNELVFEVFGFAEYAAVPPARLVAFASDAVRKKVHKQTGTSTAGNTALIMDSGFSFTHAVPVIDGWERTSASRRLNLGGKALTNHLKEVVSFRSWNMMEETAVVNAVKERTCYVATRFEEELKAAKSTTNIAMKCDYILPDLSRAGSDPLGHVRRDDEEVDGSEQILAVNNERISVPELLFRPPDIGIPQGSVAEIIVQAVEGSPAVSRADLYANIVLVGGNCRFDGFRRRLCAELRPLVSENYAVNVSMAEDPVLTAYYGGEAALRERNANLFPVVTKAEYEEHGHAIATRRFESRAVADF